MTVGRARAPAATAARLFLLQGVLYFIGACFFDVNTVIPLFIESVTGRVEWAGVASTISKAAALFFQVLVGAHVGGVKNAPRYVALFLGLGYAMPIAMLIPIALGLRGTALAVCMFCAVGVFWSADGAAIVAYYDLFGRTVSGRDRGRVLGMQQFLGSAGAIGGAVAVKAILDAEGLPLTTRYSLLFLIGGALMLMGIPAVAAVRDDPERRPQTARHRERFGEMLRCAHRNAAFRDMLACQVFFQISAMSAPYLLLMARKAMALPETTISTLLFLQVLGALLGGGLVAGLSPRRGSRVVSRMICVISMASALAGWLAAQGSFPAVALAALSVVASGMTAASWAAFMGATIDLAEERHRPLYIAFTSLVTLPVAASGVLAGQIVLRLGYSWMLGICFVAGALAAYFAGRGVTRPRKERAV